MEVLSTLDKSDFINLKFLYDFHFKNLIYLMNSLYKFAIFVKKMNKIPNYYLTSCAQIKYQVFPHYS